MRAHGDAKNLNISGADVADEQILPGHRLSLTSLGDTNEYPAEARGAYGEYDGSLVKEVTGVFGKKGFLTATDFESYSGWEEFYQKYPDANGYFTFSRVGFSQDGRTALFSVSSHHAPLHAKGQFVIMRYDGDSCGSTSIRSPMPCSGGWIGWAIIRSDSKARL